MKSFYDYNRNSPEERHERDMLYPELSKFHIALREELSEEEYQQFYKAEQEEAKRSRTPTMLNQQQGQWIRI